MEPFSNSNYIHRRVYKVTVENIKTKEIMTILEDAHNSYEASEAVLDNLGKDFEPLKTIAAKPWELH